MLTQEQVNNWKDFAFRMAKACFADSDRPPLNWIISEIQSVFDEIGDDACLYLSWDRVHPYPEGHKYHGVDYLGMRKGPGYLCDLLSEMVEQQIWDRPYRFATQEQAAKLDELWDGGEDQRDEGDELREEIIEEWSGPVHSCIRAGLDMVAEQSAGVVGFEMGDLLKMYPEGLPDWLAREFTVDLTTLPAETPILL